MKNLFLLFAFFITVVSSAEKSNAEKWQEATGGKTSTQLAVEMFQSVLAANMNKDAASVINAAIGDYCLNEDSSARTAAKAALDRAISTYIHDSVARDAVQSAVNSVVAGSAPDYSSIAKTILIADANSAIDKMAGLTDEQRAAAKASVVSVVSKQTSPTQAVKNNLGTVLTSALTSVGVKNASEFGSGVDSYMQTGKTDALTQAGVNAAIDAIPGLTDKQKADAKAAAGSVLSGDKAVGVVVKEEVGRVVTDALKAAGVRDSTATEIGAGVDSYVQTGTTDALTQAGVNAAIDAIPGLTDKQKADAKAAAGSVLSGDKTVGAVVKEEVGRVVTDALKAAGVRDSTATEIGAGVDSYVQTGTTDALTQSGVNAAIDAIPGLTDKQKADAKAAAGSVLSGDKTLGDIAEDAAGRAVAEALANAGVAKETAAQIGQGLTDVLYDSGNTANLVNGSVDAAIDSISGLTDEQRMAAKKAAKELISGETTIGEVTKQAVGDAVSKALQDVGISAETAKQIGQGITDVLKNPSDTANLVAGGLNAAVDAIPGLTEAQKAVVRKAVGDVMSGEKSLGKVSQEMINNAVVDALQKMGIDPAQAQAIAGTVSSVVDNFVNGSVDWGKVGESVLTHAEDIVFGENGLLNEWIDDSDLPDDIKIIAKGVVGELSGDEGALMAAGQEALAEMLMEAGLTREQAAQIAGAAGTLAQTYLDGGDIEQVVSGMIENAKTIFCARVGEMIDKQLQKLAEKFPFLKKLFDELGITGVKIAQFLSNLNFAKVKAAFEALLDMTWEDWKRVLSDLYKAVLDPAVDKLCQYINEVIDDVLQKLLSKAMAAISKIKGLDDYMVLFQIGGTMVTDIVGTEAKGIINSTGASVKSLFEIKKEE